MTHRIVAMVVAAGFAAACSGADDMSSSTSNSVASVPTVVETTVGSTPVFVRNSDDVEGAAAPVVAAPDSTTTSTTTTIPLVPDTGVPGIDSEDVFCRSWSQFAGSFRAIGLVSAIRDVEAGMRLEVIASASVVGAIDGMSSGLPAELEPERDTLLSQFAGPFGRRAARANEALTSAGLTSDDVTLLSEVWLITLADVGIDDPSLDIEIPAAVDAAAVREAVTQFSAATPAIRDDPSLTTFTKIPLTDAYTFANCPDGGTLAGNDDL